MIASLISMLPTIAAGLFVLIITWFISRMWYTSQYIHRDEVRPLQESQHIMQNQYAILAERIKHTEAQLTDAKNKLEASITAKEEALQKIIELEIRLSQSTIKQPQLTDWSEQLSELVKKAISETAFQLQPEDEADKNKTKEQFNLLKQFIKEFKTEFSQKLNSQTSQYHELSNQLWQLLDLNKKMMAEAETTNKLIQNTDGIQDEKSSAEQPFKLASIKKRS
jgi:hypothetical protein